MSIHRFLCVFILIVMGIFIASCDPSNEKDSRLEITRTNTTSVFPSETPHETTGTPTKTPRPTPDLTATFWPSEVTKTVPEEFKQYIGMEVPPYPEGMDGGTGWGFFTNNGEEELNDWGLDMIKNPYNQIIIFLEKKHVILRYFGSPCFGTK